MIKLKNGTDLYASSIIFLCCAVEHVSRFIKQKNQYTIEKMDLEGINHVLNFSKEFMTQDYEETNEEFIEAFDLKSGVFDITSIPEGYNKGVPDERRMGYKYGNLVLDMKKDGETYAETIIRVYNNSYCDILDDYRTGAFMDMYENLLLDFEDAENGVIDDEE